MRTTTMGLLFTLAIAQVGRATLLTFDDLPSGGPIINPYRGTIISTSGHEEVVDATAFRPEFPGAQNAVVSGPNVLLTAAQPWDIHPVDWNIGRVLTINSGYFTAAVEEEIMIKAEGRTWTGTPFKTSFLVTSQRPTFVSFNWGQLSEFTLQGVQLDSTGTRGARFIIDNLTVNAEIAEAPEPGSLSIVTGAMLWLILRRKRISSRS